MKNVHQNILGTIGNTPLVKLNTMVKDIEAHVYAKIETFNPGNSIKDRMALKMIEDAEISGVLKPGGTIIEGTSGNTGMGLAIAAVLKGYKCIFTTTDKQSKEKIDALRAFGAEVIVCPTNVDPEDPRSYYSVSSRLVNEIPNAWKPNQYDNPSNAQAHYETTGPEIWEQLDGKVDHLVVGVGTGGTICGTAKFLKERNPQLKVWGIDTFGSVFKKYKETGIFDKDEIYPYITEGIGEDFLPQNVDFSLIDHFEKVTDKAAAIYTRRIPKEEGIFAGNSAGAAMAGIDQLKHHFKAGENVVVIFHDHGTRYLAKMFNDEWMRDRGFLDTKPTLKSIIAARKNYNLVYVTPKQLVSDALALVTESNISQIPVIDNDAFVGSISEKELLRKIVADPELAQANVMKVIEPAFPWVNIETPLEEVSQQLTKQNEAVMVRDNGGNYHIITHYDIFKALC